MIQGMWYWLFIFQLLSCLKVPEKGTLALFICISASCLSWVPEKGTVGASGDLAPLSHLALGMMGEGKMWSPESGWGEARYVLESHGLTPIKLEAKEVRSTLKLTLLKIYLNEMLKCFENVRFLTYTSV